jgi:Met-zincin/Domain of unknown function (DUF5117)
MRLAASCVLALAFAVAVSLPARADAPATIAAKTAGFERHDGRLPWYWDPRGGHVFFEIRAGDSLLYGVSLATGLGSFDVGLDRARLGGLGLVRFERVGGRVLLRQLQTTQRGGANPDERRAAEESFPTSVLAAFPLTAESGGKLLVDATDFLLGDALIVPTLRATTTGDWHADRDRSVIRPDGSGAFPLNSEIEVELTFVGERIAPAIAALLPDGRTLTMRVHHTFLALPAPGFETRACDPRVGFFGEAYQEHSAHAGESPDRAWADRWRLVKRDPSAAASPPVQPLVYYLDPAIPEPERSTARNAVLWWNHAFEQAGFTNAVQVRDLPPGASLLDARYPGIAWVDRAERAFSIGQAQADPRTGEILHAVVILDSHRRRTTGRIWDDLAPPRGAGCDAADSPDASEILGSPNAPRDSMVLWRLAYLVAHEVGHTLGLEHNWAATSFPGDHWGSVMDYLAPNIRPVSGGGFDLSDAYPHDIGSYDVMAIQWGYTPGADRATLDAIVRRAAARGVERPADADWRWAEYDLDPDPAAWLGTCRTVRRAMLARFGPRQLDPGTPLYDLQRRLNLAYLYHRFAIQACAQAVGGRLLRHAVAGDTTIASAWADDRLQRRALDAMLACLAPSELDLPDRVVAAMVPAPSYLNFTGERFGSEAGDVFSPLSAARVLAALVIRPLTDPEHAARLTLRSDTGALTLDAVLGRLVSATWGAAPEKSPRLAALQRVTQRVALDGLLDLAAEPAASPEVRAAALARLASLRKQVHLRHATDPAAEAHLRAAERDLDDAFEHPSTRRTRPLAPPAPPGRPIGE